MCAQLTIHTIATDHKDRFETYWAVGGKQGIIEITLADQVPDDRAIVAELAALHHLLSRKGVAGCDRNGHDLLLQVTFGAIRKLMQGSTTKKHLEVYGRFLLARYADAKITVSKDTRWVITARAENRREQITVTGPEPEVLEVPAIGRVGISGHLIERLMERANYASVGAAWRHLRKMLSNPRASLETEPSREKSAKHHMAAQYLRIPGEAWRFVVAPGERGHHGGLPILVTAYVR